MNPYQIVCESLKSQSILYHGSPIQNLKVLESKKKSFRFKTDSPRIFLSDEIDYASAFTWEWKNNDGIELGNINNGPWIIEIPIRFKKKIIASPCSIYVVKNTSDIKQIKGQKSEYVSMNPLKVYKELKFKNPLEAMDQNGLEVKWK